MTYTNPLMVERMVPRGPETRRRIYGFFEGVGWYVRDHSTTEFDTYVSPLVSTGPTPTVDYWQTTDPDKNDQFIEHGLAIPSEYARGRRLPRLLDLVEVSLIVPTDDDVHAIFDQGGPLLEAHTYIPPREHVGRQEFRFADPFNYAYRVTANPGYEVNLPAG
jgi:hypothetical protein